MKYSQAVLVASIAGAAFVSAAPTVTARIGSVVVPNTQLQGRGAPASGANANAAADKPTTETTTPTSATPSDPSAQSGQHAQHQNHHHKGHKGKHLTPEEKKAKAEKWKHMSPAEKQALKDKKKAHKHEKAHAKAGSGAGHSASTTSTPLSTRDLDEDLFVRAVTEELEARGLWANLKANYAAHKAESQAPAVRDFIEEEMHVARDELEGDLALRDLEDGLEARDFDDLDARGLRAAWKALGDTMAGRKGADPMLQQRDLEDLDVRDFDSLDVRGLRAAWKALGDTMAGRKGADPTLQQRDFDFDDELALRDLELDDVLYSRDLDDDLEARGWWANLKANYKAQKAQSQGMSQAPPAEAPMRRRDFFDIEDLDIRDLVESELDRLD